MQAGADGGRRRAPRRRASGATCSTPAEEEAAGRGAREIVLHAQTQAETFYAGSGFAPEGNRFMEEGIEHIQMRKAISPGP